MAENRRWILASVALATLALGAGVAGSGCTGSTGNHDPLLTTLDPIRIAVGERKQMSVTAADDDGDDIEFRFQLTLFPGDPAKEKPLNQNVTLDRGMKWIAASTTAIFEWGPSPNHVGEHTLTIVADDGNGGVVDATAAVTVIAGQEQGSPRFESHPNLVLDLARTQCLRARVAVDDPDSIEVELSLEGAPEGMEIKAISDTGKEAQIEWCPEREQLADRNVFTFFAVADDGEHQAVRQRMSVVIRRAAGGGGTTPAPAEGCPQNMQAPTIEAIPIEDQSGDEDFVIEADIYDAETPISDAFVSFSWHSDPGNFPCYISDSLLQAEESLWAGSIPGVSRLVGEEQEGCDPIDLNKPVRFYYYLCAWDSDDPNRAEDDPEARKCDNATCEPNQSQFTFVWSPAGGVVPGGGCPDDPFEDNDTRETASAIGDGEGFGLVSCPDDADWYKIGAQAGDTLVVGAQFPGDGGQLAVQAFGPDGAAVGAPPAEVPEGQVLLRIPDAVEGEYIVGITGQDVGEGGEAYNFILRRDVGGGGGEGAACPADAGEPNDTKDSPTALAVGPSGPYGLCGAGDAADWYSFHADAGAAIEIDALFAHENGDLDIELWPPGAARRVARGFSANDNEHIEFNANAAGDWLLGVVGWRDASNTYRLELSVGEGDGGGEDPGGDPGGEGGGDPPPDPECAADGGAEPNNEFGAAQVLDGPVDCATIQEGDEDWWRVNVGDLEGFTATVGFDDREGDIDVEVYAADGSTKLLTADSVTDDEIVVYPGAPAGGAIYMKVLLYGGDSNTYSINLSKQAFGLGPIGRCPADNEEPNDSIDAPKTVILRDGAATRRALTWCGDDDWYRVRLPAGGGNVLLGELVYETGQAELVIELTDADGNAVGNVTPGANGTVEIESRHEGNNYLHVSGAQGAPPTGLYWFEFVVLLEV